LIGKNPGVANTAQIQPAKGLWMRAGGGQNAALAGVIPRLNESVANRFWTQAILVRLPPP